MEQDQLKRMVAEAARDEVLALPAGQVLGIGTGSTANWFIDLLAPHKEHFAGVVSSSVASTQRLLQHGFYVLDANAVTELPAYVDGADEVDPSGYMIKGGGGALTREKIIAALAQQFICICDQSKQVATLGKFPLPIEIIPLAQGSVMRAMQALGGNPCLRLIPGASNPFVTDNGGWIIDVAGLHIAKPAELETLINQIPGVITVGLFTQQKADVLLLGGPSGVKRIVYS
ncbi:MAG: ribose-5-phosphate isomerase RpiA [Polynucleobacter sp.]|nr:ribose-5-phosphate isomerase RpiA [Polynucleobacter sp.]MDZ4056859.1 ribose-5-phosphate isomerase RpiA [Polynucleobacter sp.]